MKQTDSADTAEQAYQEVDRARFVLSMIIAKMYQDREYKDLYKFLPRSEESQRAAFTKWSEAHTGASQKELVSGYILSELHMPMLQALTDAYGIEQDKNWQVATTYVHTWKLVEAAMKERYEGMPDGELKSGLTEQIRSAAQSFTTVLPPQNRRH
jgi:hypothetical protein